MERNSVEDMSDLNKVSVLLEEERPLKTNEVTTLEMFILYCVIVSQIFGRRSVQVPTCVA
jgi:hypothetical protein